MDVKDPLLNQNNPTHSLIMSQTQSSNDQNLLLNNLIVEAENPFNETNTHDECNTEKLIKSQNEQNVYTNLNSLNCGDDSFNYDLQQSFMYNSQNTQKMPNCSINDPKLSDEENYNRFKTKFSQQYDSLQNINDTSKIYPTMMNQFVNIKNNNPQNFSYSPSAINTSSSCGGVTNYDSSSTNLYRNSSCNLNSGQMSLHPSNESNPICSSSNSVGYNSDYLINSSVSQPSNIINSQQNSPNFNCTTLSQSQICPSSGFDTMAIHNNTGFSCSCPYCISMCQQQWYMNYYGQLQHFPTPGLPQHQFPPAYMIQQAPSSSSTSVSSQQAVQHSNAMPDLNQLNNRNYDPTYRPIMLMKPSDIFYPGMLPSTNDSQEVDQKLAHLTPIYINQPVPSNTEHFQRRTPFKKRDHNALSWLLLYLELEKDVDSPTMNAKIAWINDMHHVIYTKLTSGLISRWQYEYDFSQLRHLITQKSNEADEMFKLFPKLCHCGERFKNEIELSDHLIHCIELKSPWHRCLCGQLFDQHNEFFMHIFSGVLQCPMAVYHLWIFFEKYRRRRYKCFCSIVFHNFWVYYVHMGECVEYQNYFQRNCYFCQDQIKKSIESNYFWAYPMMGPLTDLVRQSKIQ